MERKRTYAVIDDRGRRHKVHAGARVLIDLMDAKPGTEVTFDKVVVLSPAKGEPKIGTPTVAGASVVAVVEGEQKGEKLKIFKWRRRENYRRRIGHRQRFTQVRIRKIAH
jgi:large subunit ribosomal protein L21